MVGVGERIEQTNSCCEVWKQKYAKLEEKKNAFRQAVKVAKLLAQQVDEANAANLNHKKAYEEEKERADVEKAGKDKESEIRISLENKISDMNSEILLLREKVALGQNVGNEEVMTLQKRIFEGEREINQLEELLEKEKLKADLGRKNAEAEKSKADEGKRLAEIERKNAEKYRVQMENKIFDLNCEILLLKEKVALGPNVGNEEAMTLQKCISEGEREINRLKELLEKEKLKADLGRKNAEAEKKSIADEGKRLAEIERNNAEKYRLQMENKISDLNSEILLLKKKVALGPNVGKEEVMTLQKRVSEGEREINRLKELLEKEKLRADLGRKNAEAEKKSTADEGKRLAEIERKNAEKYRLQMENKISDLNSEILLLKEKVALGPNVGNEEVMTLQKRISEGEREINRLKELLEKEKLKADLGRKNAEAEKKSIADEGKRLAEIERKNAEKYRLQMESSKKEVDEARSRLVLATSKSEEANRMLEAQKQKVVKEKKCADAEKAKSEKLRKLVEQNNKKFMEEKSLADHLSRQLKDNNQKIEELQKEIHDLVSSKKLDANAVPPHKRSIDETANMKDRLQSDTMKRESEQAKLVSELTKALAAEKRKAIKEKKRADSEMQKAEEQRKLTEVNREKAMVERSRADELSRQLEDDKQRISELQKEIRELVSSRNSAEASAKSKNSDTAKMKLLKEKLKLEKMRVKHAKEVANLEKGRNSILQQEVGRLKQDTFKFLHRLEALDKCFSCSIEGTDDMYKAGEVSNLQSKRECSVREPLQMYLRGENELVKPACRAMDSLDSSHHFGQTFKSNTAPLLPISRMNIAEFSSGIDSKLGSPFGGSDRKTFQSSAMSSSMGSFSDGQLMGSQEKGAYSVTMSAKLPEENLNYQQANSRLSGEVIKTGNSENVALVTANSVRSHLNTDDFGRSTGHGKKRKRILDAVESIEYLYSLGTKLQLQIEEKLSVLHNVLNKQICNPLDERCLVPILQDHSHANFNGVHKRRKKSHKQKQVMQQLIDGDERKKTGQLNANSVGRATPPASNLTGSTQSCRDGVIDFVMDDQEILVSFEKMADGDYMKLLDLDNAVEEECYRMAMERPLSPTLPEIELENVEVSARSKGALSVDEMLFEGLSDEKDNMAPSRSFDVNNVDISSNHSNRTSYSPLLHKKEGLFDPPKCQGNKETGFSNAICEGKGCLHHIEESSLEVDRSNMCVSVDEGANQCESELKSRHDCIPEYCIVFSDNKDIASISKIYRATRNCIARCYLFSHSDWAVQHFLHAIVVEDLLSREKVCVFFSLLLYNFSGAARRNFGNFLTSASTLCLDSFAGHIRSVISDVETRSLFLESFCLDELVSLIEDFLIDGRLLVHTDLSSEASKLIDSRIKVSLDSADVVLSYKTASNDQLVSGSIILASVCVAVEEIGFICEASYNILQVRRTDPSLLLTILHIFAHLCGKEYFTLCNYSLIMVVIKSVVTCLERGHVSVGTASLPFVSEVRPEFPPCLKCPFSVDAISVDALITLLLEKLQNYAVSGNIHQDLMESANSLSSIVQPDEEKFKQDNGVVNMNADVSCCLYKVGIHATQSDSVVGGSLCHYIDVLSLVELIACNMSWAWLCKTVVPQLFRMLESCALENFSAAIVILLGQFGRIGVGANGYEDTEVENMRSRLTTFLHQNSTVKLCLPVQMATVGALLGLLSLNFESLVQSDVELAAITSQSPTSDAIRKWFSSLSNEQQSLSLSVLQSIGVDKN